MKIFLISLLSFMSSFVLADGQYACMNGKSVGLNWDKGNWEMAKFQPENFLLSITKDGKVMEKKVAGEETTSAFKCDSTKSDVLRVNFLNCFSRSAGYITFDLGTLSGGYSTLLGSVMTTTAYKDSLIVANFSCQKF